MRFISSCSSNNMDWSGDLDYAVVDFGPETAMICLERMAR